MNNYLFPPSTKIIPSHVERNRRVMYGALSGFLVGTICILVNTFINTWLYPELPIHLSWPDAFKLWLIWTTLGTVLGGVSAISSEGWFSILLSAFLMTLAILIMNFRVNDVRSLFLNLLIIMGLSLPFTAVMLPLAYVFFWLSRRFLLAETLASRERIRIILVNVLVIIGLGFLPGLYARFNVRAERGMTLIHEMLQAGAQAESVEAYPLPLRKTGGYTEHKDQAYTLSQVKSSYSTVGVDVTVHYEDGYELKCTVILYSSQNPNINPCKSVPQK
jgi:hypothetical protein